MPPSSLHNALFLFPVGSPAHLRAGLVDANSTLDLWLEGRAGQRYVIEVHNRFTELVLDPNERADDQLSAHGVFRAVWIP